MTYWSSIEYLDVEHPIWVITYDMYEDANRQFCSVDDDWVNKFTSCHGWYESYEDAVKVLNHFPRPNSYRIEKVHKRVLLS